MKPTTPKPTAANKNIASLHDGGAGDRTRQTLRHSERAKPAPQRMRPDGNRVLSRPTYIPAAAQKLAPQVEPLLAELTAMPPELEFIFLFNGGPRQKRFAEAYCCLWLCDLRYVQLSRWMDGELATAIVDGHLSVSGRPYQLVNHLLTHGRMGISRKRFAMLEKIKRLTANNYSRIAARVLQDVGPVFENYDKDSGDLTYRVPGGVNYCTIQGPAIGSGIDPEEVDWDAFKLPLDELLDHGEE